jgi:hypothetical protein
MKWIKFPLNWISKKVLKYQKKWLINLLIKNRSLILKENYLSQKVLNHKSQEIIALV